MKSITFILIQLWLLGFSISLITNIIQGADTFYFVSFIALGFNATILLAERIVTKQKEKEEKERQTILSFVFVQKTLIHFGITVWLIIIYLSFIWNWGELDGNKTYLDCALLAFSVNLLVVISELLIKWQRRLSLLDAKEDHDFGWEILRFIKNMSLLLITILLGAIWLGFVYGAIEGSPLYRNTTLIAFAVYLLIVLSENGAYIEKRIRHVLGREKS